MFAIVPEADEAKDTAVSQQPKDIGVETASDKGPETAVVAQPVTGESSASLTKREDDTHAAAEAAEDGETGAAIETTDAQDEQQQAASETQEDVV